MGEESQMKVYVWANKSTDGKEAIFFIALAENQHDAVDKVLLKAAAKMPDGDRLMRADQDLRSRTPAEVEFSGGAGFLSIDLDLIQKLH
jgi:hypothetical protein